MLRLGPALAILATLAIAAPVTAQPTLWERITDDRRTSVEKRRAGQPPPGLSAVDHQLWLGRYYTIKLAQRRGSRYPRRNRILWWTTARNAYEKALAFEPEHAEAHLRLAELIVSAYAERREYGERLFFSDTQIEHWRAKALHHWEQFEKLRPRDPRITDLRMTRSLEYTREGSKLGLEKALADYRAIMDELDLESMSADEAGRLTSNRAEVHMMLGQMPEAITWYERSLLMMPDADWAFGLAVAYDRDGQGMRAREKIGQYATKGTLEAFAHQLDTGQVFFVPQAEVYYYYGLIHETMGNYDLAIDAFQRFVASGAHPAFHARARDNIKNLTALVRKHGATRHKSDHWSRHWHRRHMPGGRSTP